jgi:tRNA pseudouridine38-40 synthase
VSHPERRVRLDLAYDGTDFAGWQVQRGQRTVQGVLEQVLSEIQGAGHVSVRGAGRTDAGVHARHQVADCAVRSRLADPSLEQALRSMLPLDLRPLSLRTASPSFHARKDAVSKTYRYRVDLSRHGDPFDARYALHYPHRLDVELLATAMEQLPGRRDWTGFAASACDKRDRVRRLSVARLERPSPERLWLTFAADGFLQHMVRNLAGTLLEIGGGRMPPETIAAVLASGDRNLAGPTAPARGLCLMRVRYAEDPEASPGRAEDRAGPVVIA